MIVGVGVDIGCCDSTAGLLDGWMDACVHEAKAAKADEGAKRHPSRHQHPFDRSSDQGRHTNPNAPCPSCLPSSGVCHHVPRHVPRYAPRYAPRYTAFAGGSMYNVCMYIIHPNRSTFCTDDEPEYIPSQRRKRTPSLMLFGHSN